MKSLLIKFNKNPIIFWIINASMIAFIYYLTSKAWYSADDYYYKFIYGADNRVTCLKDIVISQYNHYFMWGGRTVAHTLGQFFLLKNKIVFNISNSVVYSIMAMLIYMHSTGQSIKKHISNYTILIIYLATWICIPVYAECILWLIGSVNYLWTITIILAFLLPFRFFYEKGYGKNKFLYSVGMFLFGIIAGWTNENTAIVSIFFILILIIYSILKKEKLPKWIYTGLIGNLIGYIFMILAPGNYVRFNMFNYHPDIKHRFINFYNLLDKNLNGLAKLFFFLFVLLVLAIICFSSTNYNLEKNRKKIIIGTLFAIGTIISILSMVASPYFPERALFGSMIFALTSGVSMISSIDLKKIGYLEISIGNIYISLLICIFLFTVKLNLPNIIKLNDLMKQRDAYIESQVKQGNKDIIVKPINIKSGQYVINEDMKTDPKYWINEVIRKYYDLHSIQVK